MRHNQPVSPHQYLFDAPAAVISSSDLSGSLTGAGEAFVTVNGFNTDEIHHPLHSRERHPEMPADAFADMWATLKQGEPWSGLVQSQRSNGDRYWVRANAIPVVRNGTVQGYMSVRTKPSAEEVQQAEQLSRQFGQDGQRFYQRLMARSDIMRWRSLWQKLSLRWRIRRSLITLLLLSVPGVWLLNIAAGSMAALTALMAIGLLLAGHWLEHQLSRPAEQTPRAAGQGAVSAVRSLQQHIILRIKLIKNR